jgi:meso-butanediol dehydrogenase/(S,S)-butanediol dehydrogenase/diacetyl reductase
VERLVNSAVDRYGKLDIIFNNAGIAMGGSILQRSEEDFDRLVAVNLKGVFLGCKHALPHLLDNPDGGVILNMSSNGGLIGRPGDPLYVATKHGVMGLTGVHPQHPPPGAGRGSPHRRAFFAGFGPRRFSPGDT